MKMNFALFKLAFLFQALVCIWVFSSEKERRTQHMLSLPKEVAVLRLPKDEPFWKAIVRQEENDYCLVERIPINQDATKWSQKIGNEIYREINKKKVSIDQVADIIKTDLANHYPAGTTITWTILRKNASELLYEYVLNSKLKDIPSCHEIARVFLTNEGMYRVGYTRRFNEMSKNERAKWIEVLERDVFLESLGIAFEMEHAISIW